MGDSIAHEPNVLVPEIPPAPDAGSAPRSKLLGAELAHARREAGLTQRELADRLDVRLWMVDQWEAGAKAIPHGTLERISAAIGTPAAARVAGRDIDSAHRPSAQTLVKSDAMSEILPRRLTPQEIRDAQLPRSLRGYEEGATRRLLGDVAAAYERSVNQCDELRRQLDEQEAGRIDPEEHEFLEAERDELRDRVNELTKAAKSGGGDAEKVAAERDKLVAERDGLAAERDELTAARDEIAAERDELRKRADKLAKDLAARERTPTPTGEQDELRQRVGELEQTLAGYTESEQALTRALVAASRAGEELVKEAEAEAQAILVDARRAAEQIEREIDDRRGSFETERASLVDDLKREALASARDDLDALGRATKPVLEALAVLEERIRAIAPPEPEAPAKTELLEDLKAPRAGKAAATAEADRA